MAGGGSGYPLVYGGKLKSHGDPQVARVLDSLPPSGPARAAVLNDLGNFYASLGHTRDAELSYREAIEEDPTLLPARRNLAMLLLSQDRLADSAREFQAILKEHPDDARAHYGLGACYEKQRKRDEAIAEYEEALRLDKNLRYLSENPNLLNSRYMNQVMLRLYKKEGGSVALPLIPSSGSN